MTAAAHRHFLMLQGPHGPFFGRLADALRASGHEVTRVGFNAGDRAFWGRRAGYLAWRGSLADWTAQLPGLLSGRGVTDLICYGETRSRHAVALRAARDAGVRTHILEEGYLRPYWITYERDGSNGNSPLMNLSVADIATRVGTATDALTGTSGHWGDLAAHVFWGAIYHAALLSGRSWYPGYVSHRSQSVGSEGVRYARRAVDMPLRRIRRRIATHRLLAGGRPYHICLLQLAHDANFLDHGPFATQEDFLDTVLEGFAKGAPAHHMLVVKAHPLEDGRVPIARVVADLARRHGCAGRVVLIDGGKLAPLLREAQSAVTVNSTAGQQALWHGVPLRIFGRAVYDKPEFTSRQSPDAFFAAPFPPDREAYLTYRRFLLETSQVSGGFYSAKARARLLRSLVDLVLADHDRYETVHSVVAPRTQPVRLVR